MKSSMLSLLRSVFTTNITMIVIGLLIGSTQKKFMVQAQLFVQCSDLELDSGGTVEACIYNTASPLRISLADGSSVSLGTVSGIFVYCNPSVARSVDTCVCSVIVDPTDPATASDFCDSCTITAISDTEFDPYFDCSNRLVGDCVGIDSAGLCIDNNVGTAPAPVRVPVSAPLGTSIPPPTPLPVSAPRAAPAPFPVSAPRAAPAPFPVATPIAAPTPFPVTVATFAPLLPPTPFPVTVATLAPLPPPTPFPAAVTTQVPLSPPTSFPVSTLAPRPPPTSVPVAAPTTSTVAVTPSSPVTGEVRDASSAMSRTMFGITSSVLFVSMALGMMMY